MHFEELCNDYLRRCWKAEPVRTTRSGMPGYDHLLRDVSLVGLAADLAEVKRLLAACDGQDVTTLTADQRLDLECMKSDLEDALLQHEMAEWTRNPEWYASEIADGIDLLAGGTSAPTPERVAALESRLQASVGILTLAPVHLRPELVPSLWVTIAQQAVGATRKIVAGAVARTVRDGGSAAARITPAGDALLTALDDYAAYLAELGPRASGDYAVGREMFSRILQKRHRLDLTADSLYAWGQEMVARYQADLDEAARRIDPDRPWTEIMAEIRNHYPPADQWLQAFMDNMATARQHLVDHDLITIPEGEHCEMIWTPEHMWATHPLGGVDMSAPYTPDLESRFFVTPNNEAAPLERQLQHHRDLNYAFLRSIALHEVYPGHHLQSVHAKQGQSPVRRWQHSTTLVEGWGLYTETLMHETGYLDDPNVQLMYAKNSLWRAVRVVIDVGLHALGMTFEEAVAMLQEKLCMEEHMAAGEVRRYTMSPTYQSSYLLGRTAILEMREACRKRLGSAFTLKKFHDHLLSYGSAPVTLIRSAMLGE